jgi:hypothetical protein
VPFDFRHGQGGEFLSRRGLTRPDERALHRYRMVDGEYDQAKKHLHNLAREGRLAHPDYRAGALFVAYCAEWFRRESDSTFLRWDDPAPDLFPSVPYASKQQLTRLGLSYWRRDSQVPASSLASAVAERTTVRRDSLRRRLTEHTSTTAPFRAVTNSREARRDIHG